MRYIKTEILLDKALKSFLLKSKAFSKILAEYHRDISPLSKVR